MEISFFKIVLLAVATLGLTSCASFTRSSASGYGSGQGLGRDEANEAPIRVTDLIRAERELEGRREREQYFTNRPYMKNDRERLEFLQLPSFYERQKWLAKRQINNGVQHHNVGTQNLIDAGDIAVGMTFQAVRSSWGEPEKIEAAGNPMYGNQRWYFSEQKSSPDGYQSQKRIVIFREGRVAGWETR